MVTTDDINNLIQRIKCYAARNRAMKSAALRRCIRHLGRALDGGQAARRMCLSLAEREFNAMVAKVAAREEKTI